MNNRIDMVREELQRNKKKALVLIKKLETEDIYEKLELLDSLDSLSELPADSVATELKDYQETKQIYKRLYTLAARTIIQILSSDFMHGMHDPSSSFNYSDPKEPLKAVSKIRFLPKAYRGGPIKAAVMSPYLRVSKMAVEYYDTLPQDLKFSQTFPDQVRRKIRNIRAA